MNVSDSEIRNVLSLSGSDRYIYFVKKVADWQEVWGLYQDGWAMVGNGSGDTMLPLWPAKAYAGLCAIDEWEGYTPKAISLQCLMADVLPTLAAGEILPCVFYLPTDRGVTPSVKRLLADLAIELEKY